MILCCLALAACGQPAAAVPSTAPAVAQTPTLVPADTPVVEPAPTDVPAATRTAAAVAATFVAARATVTAAAVNSTATAQASAVGPTVTRQAIAAQTISAADTKTPRLTSTEMAAIGRAGTVYIKRDDGASGSGAYLGQDLILTAAHVIANSSHSFKLTFDGRDAGSASIVAFNIPQDVGLLKDPQMAGSGAKPLAWGDSTILAEGDPLMLIGYPAGIGLTITQGIVSGLKTRRDMHLVQTDASMNHGNSGGPMLNSRGQLVAIASYGVCGTTGLNFGIASETAHPFVDNPRTILEPNPFGSGC
ncbi:MAG: serine protease [Chloroflexi bacterium]|nr:serine protease [Chloroflexota bacterium]